MAIPSSQVWMGAVKTNWAGLDWTGLVPGDDTGLVHGDNKKSWRAGCRVGCNEESSQGRLLTSDQSEVDEDPSQGTNKQNRSKDPLTKAPIEERSVAIMPMTFPNLCQWCDGASMEKRPVRDGNTSAGEGGD